MIFIAIIAVFLLGLYDYLHDKTNWTLKTSWPKYTIALASTLIISLLEKWQFFQYLQTAGLVVLAGLFYSLLSKWLASLWAIVKTWISAAKNKI